MVSEHEDRRTEELHGRPARWETVKKSKGDGDLGTWLARKRPAKSGEWAVCPAFGHQPGDHGCASQRSMPSLRRLGMEWRWAHPTGGFRRRPIRLTKSLDLPRSMGAGGDPPGFRTAERELGVQYSRKRRPLPSQRTVSGGHDYEGTASTRPQTLARPYPERRPINSAEGNGRVTVRFVTRRAADARPDFSRGQTWRWPPKRGRGESPKAGLE